MGLDINQQLSSILGGDLGVNLGLNANKKKKKELELRKINLGKSNDPDAERRRKIEEVKEGLVWTTERINLYDEFLNSGEISPGDMESTPYYNNVPGIKKPRIVFHYTEEEIEELKRCANDVVYFADKYCYAMTDDGIKKITLRPYQKRILKDFQENRFVVFLAPRQIGKCVHPLTTVKTQFGTERIYEIYYRYKKDKKIIDYLKYMIYKLMAWFE
jgi:hypothetical protein